MPVSLSEIRHLLLPGLHKMHSPGMSPPPGLLNADRGREHQKAVDDLLDAERQVLSTAEYNEIAALTEASNGSGKS